MHTVGQLELYMSLLQAIEMGPRALERKQGLLVAGFFSFRRHQAFFQLYHSHFNIPLSMIQIGCALDYLKIFAN